METIMNQTRLIWCHGYLGQPWGDKSKQLAKIAENAGLNMDAIDFQDLENPDERVERLVTKLSEKAMPTILCGSSMGGYVAATTARHIPIKGLFLLAPAFYLPNYDTHVFTDLPEALTVVHGWEDDVVPVENSIRFGGLHKASLHILPDDHRLSKCIPDLCILFDGFLRSLSK
jgi:predicted alpha/beta hydrolase family esterase